MTKRYGILAYPAKHSLSPAVHNAAFKAIGLDASFEYFEVDGRGFNRFMKSIVKEKISGLAVSLPYKEKVLKYLDEIDEDARKIGAVNTIVNKGGKLCGYNTDFIGSNKALKEKMSNLKGKKAVIWGAGGAGRAIVYGLMREGADVIILNRTRIRAVKMAMEFAEMFRGEIHGGDFEDLCIGDILIHASSLWMKMPKKGFYYDDELPDFCHPVYVNKFKLVMDITYKPLITPLLECAKSLEIPFITGDKMLLYQAVEQFKLWTGKEAPSSLMRKVLKENLFDEAS